MAIETLDSIELHDARIESVKVDFPTKSVTIQIAYYPNEERRQREQATVNFEDVDSISQIADFLRLQDNYTAGNVNYWRPIDGPGVTYIYLVDGCIAISAKAVRFDPTKKWS